MSVVYMGFSLEDDLEMKEEGMVQPKIDSRENTNNLMIKNVGINSFDLVTDFDFWPIQHPTEPSHEDRPVQCPMPHSSNLINNERMQDGRFLDHKILKAKTLLCKGNNGLEARESAIRMVRKRHHDHTNTIIPLPPMSPPVYPYPRQKNHLQ
ncbi:hypothetical protein QVD17_20845 [Tagetes erecta]|uniref:Uncharacterized protein n=1 Tax=Tagetes erecta TaxID=13708 RepID=A0AAD8NXL1_TARER|nr:hypothetical protein QVD17_20845 [Tagetes erecta]